MEQVEVLDIKKDIFNVISKILGKVTVIHDFVIKKDKCEIEVGLIIKKLCDVRFALKINDKITSIKLKLNKKVYRLYLVTGSIFLALKTVCNLIKCLVFGDTEFANKLHMFSLSKKEYMKLKRNKKDFKKKIAKIHEKFGNEEDEAVVIYLSDRFYSRRNELKLEYGM